MSGTTPIHFAFDVYQMIGGVAFHNLFLNDVVPHGETS